MNMNKPFHQPVLPLPAYTPDKLWLLALEELRHQMTKTTFNHVLLGSYLLTTASTSAFWVIVVRNESACDWLTYRLNQVVKRTLVGLMGFEVTICFIPTPR
jgi:chromosomal replication initiation ATPase DnaA